MEPELIISAGALAVSIVLMLWTIRKDSKNATGESITQITTVIVKLENISKDIGEIKNDLRSIKQDVKDHSERLAKAEQKIRDLEKLVRVLHPEN